MPIDFTLTPDQRALQQSARRFARKELAGVREATGHLPTPMERFLATRPFYEAAIREGFLQRLIPAPLGGGGTGVLDLAVVAEEFQAIDVNVSLTLFGTLLGLMPVMLGGSPDQLKRLLVPFLTKGGAPLASFGFSEPGGSANFAAPAPAEGVRTTARLEDDQWVINGAKQWVSSATGWSGRGADLICVVCRTDTAASPEKGISIIAVEGPTEGVALEKAIDAVGHRSHLVPRFRMDNVRAPKNNVIGGPGVGLGLVEGSFTGTAALVGVFGVALMRAAFDFALNFARTERRGGAVPIIEHQAVGYALADAKMQIEAARYLSWRACHALDTQAPGAFELSLQSKIFGSETAVKVITDLMRVVGIDSYNNEVPLAGLLQDALAYPLFDGGNMGVRRRQLHALLKNADYDPLAASGAT
ncbi:acyl-CoA dehydrogenase [Bradyrhizobium sp. CCGB12]|uniref:acyl-CoA dehydrogenase family protein n=1 Tax=Bradyrhizobium sp. CCGB12 TaxID=2949632 RepID=UPI0020B451F0|nr:acyl-CoA dehydrogenase [Bradyrhizobium sp. CCGB12]MCP3387833.1 acyl-CoA dehydrogenase [Bradyrhizobium sp. CCGB12]